MTGDVAQRRRTVELLDELHAAGLIEYRLSSEELDGPEPHLEIWARPGSLWLKSDERLSPAASRLWDVLRGAGVQEFVNRQKLVARYRHLLRAELRQQEQGRREGDDGRDDV
jgi:glycine/D-amino acid oxidase-like deaminating enzyme